MFQKTRDNTTCNTKVIFLLIQSYNNISNEKSVFQTHPNMIDYDIARNTINSFRLNFFAMHSIRKPFIMKFVSCTSVNTFVIFQV